MSRPAHALFNQAPASLFTKAASLPADFISAYEILGTNNLSWPVAIYKLQRIDNSRSTHEDRGDLKSALWDLHREFKAQCHGYGFVIDISPNSVAIPSKWKIPSDIERGDYHISRIRDLDAAANNPEHESIVSGILREALKKQFKEAVSDYLGCLWQDMDKFCQLPKPRVGEEYCMCRRFGATARRLAGNRWVVQCTVGTATIDGKTIYDYYLEGHVDVLARMIRIKLGSKVDRRNQPISVRVLHDASDENNIRVKALELADPSLILRHGNLGAQEQRKMSSGGLLCRQFKKEVQEIPLNELKLILDSQITQEEHAETIIDPVDREVFMSHIRALMNEADVYGHRLRVSVTPFDSSALIQGFVAPPSVRVIGSQGKEVILSAPTGESEGLLKSRFRDRSEHVRKNGFLESRPINPVLIWPKRFDDLPVRRMLSDLNEILADQEAPFRFLSDQYDNVEDIKKVIDSGNHDAALVVLPEGRLAAHHDRSSHELVKQGIEVPTQCIHFDSTLPSRWLTTSSNELMRRDPKLSRRIRQRYELCITSLLVKHHWVPFAPIDPFTFNVQVGLDVGGTHNTDAVSCVGYGFEKPADGLIFRPDEIPINVQKAEPIPTTSLYQGLLRQFEVLRSTLLAAGRQPNFERTLFYKDGPLNGDGDAWNEADAIRNVHSTLRERDWISQSSVWTATEIMKYAEGWRLFRGAGEARNPLAGRYLFPFDDQDKALVCTTGSPSLTQGTACPLMVQVTDIYGRANRVDVIRDLVWQADMCFTKPDVGMRLPWVLHVADVGALQQSRSYLITGITV